MTDADLRAHLERVHQFGYLYPPTRAEMEQDHALYLDECEGGS